MITIGIDDTDSVEGGCTTYLALEVLSSLSELDTYGYPRLVRLNPNIPWKTRGNGAIALRMLPGRYSERLAVGGGRNLKKVQIGAVGTTPVFSYFPEAEGTENTAQNNLTEIPRAEDNDGLPDVLERVCEVVEKHSKLDDPKTNSGVVVGTGSTGTELYWQGVREVVELGHVKKLLGKGAFEYRGYKNGRGLIGAAAGLGWDPADPAGAGRPRMTYELIAYRTRSKWGTEREWDHESAKELNRSLPYTFDNYDLENDLPRIAPHTPCPVFYGVRSTRPADLEKALDVVRPEEPVDRWLIFETNHATDDHLQPATMGSFSPHQSVIVQGTVTGRPYTLRGGHVFVQMRDEKTDRGRSIYCAAYEPTKGFRDVVRGLREGDKVVAYGGLRSNDLTEGKAIKPTLNLEKLEIISLASISEKLSNPVCPQCGKNMKSTGKDQGYRCRKCGVHVDEGAVERKIEERSLLAGFHEVPICARRHLSTPLSMME